MQRESQLSQMKNALEMDHKIRGKGTNLKISNVWYRQEKKEDRQTNR